MGTPIRVSWWLVMIFLYQLAQSLQGSVDPAFALAYTCGYEAILILTILTHEFGHGTMAKFLGGSIVQILLWPFGGICFSTRPQTYNVRERLSNELKIVTAGPATHFPMAAIWLTILSWMHRTWDLPGNPLYALIPWRSMWPLGLGWWGTLAYQLVHVGVSMNVMLFLFNVFFPMYPMDGAKMLVCILSLCCDVPARTCAWTLLGLTVPTCLGFIAWNGRHVLSGGGGSPMGALSVMLGFMCLMESWKIYQLLERRQLHSHPLFEHARSDLIARTEEGLSRGAMRINTIDQDDDIVSNRAARSDVVPFSGSGVALGETRPEEDRKQAREQFLARVEQKRAQDSKSVRQLERERTEPPPE